MNQEPFRGRLLACNVLSFFVTSFKNRSQHILNFHFAGTFQRYWILMARFFGEITVIFISLKDSL